VAGNQATSLELRGAPRPAHRPDPRDALFGDLTANAFAVDPVVPADCLRVAELGRDASVVTIAERLARPGESAITPSAFRDPSIEAAVWAPVAARSAAL
jgi:hypothetical protein